MDTFSAYRLLAQTPLIHFQHKQAGATLRATEVKPKLDRFLKSRVPDIREKGWFLKDTEALNYKMRIIAEHTTTVNPPRLYYGNMGIANKAEHTLGILGSCRLEIRCAIPELLRELDRHIADFFICTNFGRMQNKGFGSFVVEGRSYESKEIAKLLADHAGAQHCYRIAGFAPNDTDGIFGAIGTLYSVMKSGVNHTGFGGSYHRSYLFEYCHEAMQTGNEKAAMKVKGVSPQKDGKPVCHPLNRRQAGEQDHQWKYVRALLGVGEQIGYISGFEERPDRFGKIKWFSSGKEQIIINNADIERLASPIFFKIVGGTVYMVAKRIEESIFGKVFTFTNTTTGKSLELPVPEQFDIDAFLRYFVSNYNIDSWQTERNGKPVSYSIGKPIDIVYTAQGGDC